MHTFTENVHIAVFLFFQLNKFCGINNVFIAENFDKIDKSKNFTQPAKTRHNYLEDTFFVSPIKKL